MDSEKCLNFNFDLIWINNKSMKTLGIIPARFASSRLPGKPLLDIEGVSMIQRVFNQAMQVKSIDLVVVATDDQRIYDHVESFGGHVLMTDPNHQSGTDRCGEVLKLLNQKGNTFDLVVNIQGDEPFINPLQIESLIQLFNNTPNAQIASQYKCIGAEKAQDINRVKVVTSSAGKALYFSRSMIPFDKSEQQNNPYKQHIGLYGFRSSVLLDICMLSPSKLEQLESLEQLRWLENGYSIYMEETTYHSIGIDTKADMDEAQNFLKD